MNELDEFKKVLDDDETIVKSYKPHKGRFIWLNVLISVPPSLLIAGFLVLFGVLALDSNAEESSPFNIISIILFIIAGIIVFFSTFGTLIFSYIRYNKTCYAITNKRLIIKSGIVGTDFTSLDLNMVQLVDVRVDLLDKFVKPNPGTIVIGSSSTPLVNTPNQRQIGNPTNGSFSFAHVNNPYDVAKEIKSYVASIKK